MSDEQLLEVPPVVQNLQIAATDQDKGWVTDAFKVTYQVAPYTPITVEKSGGVTVYFTEAMPLEQREIELQAARADLRARLRTECFEDLRDLIAEYKALVLEQNDAAAADQREFAQRAVETGRSAPPPPAARAAAPPAARPPATRPAATPPAPRASGPIDYGILKWPVRATSLGHNDRYGVLCHEYEMKGDQIILYGHASDKPKASMYLRNNDEGTPNFIWTRVWGDWVPESTKGKAMLPDGEQLFLIEGSDPGKVTGKGNPFSNVVKRLDVPENISRSSLPGPDNAHVLPVDAGTLRAYFETADDDGDPFADEHYDDYGDNDYSNH